MTLTPTEAAMFTIIFVGSLMLLLVLIAAPIEAAARRWPEVGRWLDTTIDRIFR